MKNLGKSHPSDNTQRTVIELRRILSQQIIPRVSAKEPFPAILAQRPLRLPQGIRARRQPAPPLKIDGKYKSNLFLAQYKKEAMHALRLPYLCYVMEGEIDMRLGIPMRQGKSRGTVNNYDILTLPANSLLFIPPGVFFPEGGLHWERASLPPADSRLFWIHILSTGAFCHTCTTRKSLHSADYYNVFIPDLQLAALTEILMDELQSSDPQIALATSSVLTVLLLRVQRGLSNGVMAATAPHDNIPPEKTVSDAGSSLVNSAVLEGARAYITRNLDSSLSIDDIANHVYVSPSRLAKLFRTELKTTVKKHVLEQRMELTRSMLKNTEISIQEIAGFTGYMQPPQFNRVFKQVHHVTPSEFRQRHRRNEK